MTKPGLYLHHRGEKYIVVGMVSNATNNAGYVPMVLYYSISHGPSDMHVRNESEFNENVEWELIGGQKEMKPRFCPLEVVRS